MCRSIRYTDGYDSLRVLFCWLPGLFSHTRLCPRAALLLPTHCPVAVYSFWFTPRTHTRRTRERATPRLPVGLPRPTRCSTWFWLCTVAWVDLRYPVPDSADALIYIVTTGLVFCDTRSPDGLCRRYAAPDLLPACRLAAFLHMGFWVDVPRYLMVDVGRSAELAADDFILIILGYLYVFAYLTYRLLPTHCSTFAQRHHSLDDSSFPHRSHFTGVYRATSPHTTAIRRLLHWLRFAARTCAPHTAAGLCRACAFCTPGCCPSTRATVTLTWMDRYLMIFICYG